MLVDVLLVAIRISGLSEDSNRTASKRQHHHPWVKSLSRMNRP
jgi:hypothetical protein